MCTVLIPDYDEQIIKDLLNLHLKTNIHIYRNH
jgi:hypothetical protein